MTLSHTDSALSNTPDISEIADAAAADIHRQVLERFASVDVASDFAEVEMLVFDSVAATGREMLRNLIEARDDAAPQLMRDDKPWHRAGATHKTIMTLLGEVSYERSRFRRRGETMSWMPVDEGLGLMGGWMTRPAAEAAVMTVAHCTYQDAEQLLQKAGAMTPSASALQDLVTAVHEHWSTAEETVIPQVREAEGIPGAAVSAAISLDGVMVPMRPGEDGRAEACWREASCGTVSFLDREGTRLGGVCLARMPEAGMASLKARLLSEVAKVQEARPDLVLVAAADGALSNWEFLAKLDPHAEVLDVWHALEHLHVVAQSARDPDGWFEKWRGVLMNEHGGVERVIRAIRYLRDSCHRGRGDVERELEFFRKNRSRMRYRALQDRNLPIGSGVVEAANKSIVCKRFKGSGMRWSMEGGQAIMTFRALILSGRFGRAWNALAANDNAKPTRQALAA